VFFPVKANSWYLACVWSGGSCEASIGTAAGQDQGVSIPFVVFGSLWPG
jgi:hypothetical protein